MEEFSLPDLEAEYTEEEGERLDAALEKYNDIRQSLAETQVGNIYQAKGSMSLKSVVECNVEGEHMDFHQAKAETLCVCWDKLDADVTELTEALTSGGGSKITMDRLEQSINTLKSLFIERQTTIQVSPVTFSVNVKFVIWIFPGAHTNCLREGNLSAQFGREKNSSC